MIYTDTERPNEVQPEQRNILKIRWFKITYSFDDNKRNYQERTVQMIGLSLADCQAEIEKSVGHRPVNILSHNSGRDINWISKKVLRILLKKNLKWYQTEEAQAARQVKIDKMKASQSAKVERARDSILDAENNKKLEQAKNKAKYIL